MVAYDRKWVVGTSETMKKEVGGGSLARAIEVVDHG